MVFQFDIFREHREALIRIKKTHLISLKCPDYSSQFVASRPFLGCEPRSKGLAAYRIWFRRK
jgi:hypothetical protein